MQKQGKNQTIITVKYIYRQSRRISYVLDTNDNLYMLSTRRSIIRVQEIYPTLYTLQNFQVI